VKKSIGGKRNFETEGKVCEIREDEFGGKRREKNKLDPSKVDGPGKGEKSSEAVLEKSSDRGDVGSMIRQNRWGRGGREKKEKQRIE